MQAVTVWDPLVRLLHWSLVVCVCVAWLSTLHVGIPLGWHEPVGYATMGILAARIAWGFVAPGHARFSSFIQSPRKTLRYAVAVSRRRAPRYIGHNPLGAWMVLALIGVTAALGFVGWLQTTDRFWGDETLDQAHVALAWALLGLVATHVAGVVLTARHQRENLVLAMIHGKKRPPEAGDVD